jgi:hypothetical protein
MGFSISLDAFRGNKVTIDDHAKTTVAETRHSKDRLIAELTWAKLYTKALHKVLGVISTALRKTKTITTQQEMRKGAEKLHDQLRDANLTVGELSDHAGIRPVPELKSDEG